MELGQLARRRLIILDLNGLLLFRVMEGKKKAYKDYLSTSKKVGNFRVWERPFCVPFVNFVLDNFDVVVWSSAMKHNVDPLVDSVFGERKAELKGVLYQNSCLRQRYPDETVKKPLFKKPLEKAWEVAGEGFDETNTLLIDDTEIKATYADNVFCPSEWTVGMEENANELSEKGTIRMYLAKLLDYDGNVQDFVKQERLTKT